MRGIICYYSGTGNTQAACEALARQIPEVDWSWHNVLKPGAPDLSESQVVGFATFTDFWSVPKKFKDFIESLPPQAEKPAFALTTFGMVSLFTQRDLGRLLRKRKFKVIGGFALHTPENYPPMILGGMTMENSPSPQELSDFKAFGEKVASILKAGENGRSIKSVRLGNPWLGWIPAPGRRMSKNSMGHQAVDVSVCTRCRTCERACPYQAITLNPTPIFNHEKCFGCWACFNRCPRQAIYTRKIRGKAHYPKPLPQLLRKLKGDPSEKEK